MLINYGFTLLIKIEYKEMYLSPELLILVS